MQKASIGLGSAIVAAALLSVGCGSADASSPGSHPSKKPSPDETKVDTTTAASEWKTVITGDWTLDPGTEGYTCVRQTLDEDLIVGAFNAINPLGTHHTLLTVGDPEKPDGTEPCTVADNFPAAIFASGVGTNELDFGDGIGVKVPKGKQLLLNLHLFNTSGDPLSGTSGTKVKLIKEEDVQNFAGVVLAGTITFDLPPHEKTTSVGTCTMPHDVTIFSVAPHMHQLGTYMKVSAEPASGDAVVLHDGPYDFREQVYYPLDPLKLTTGDQVRVECTHTNTTDKDVKFGDSSLAEMCFAGLYWYPADQDPLVCIADARF